MNDFRPWTEGGWYALGSLFVQLGFLIAAVWFARHVLTILTRFQEQLGALLKLTITADPSEPQPSHVPAKHSLTGASSYWLPPSELPISSQPQPAEIKLAEIAPGRLATAWHGFALWLNAPMPHSEVAPWRRFIHWLQAPAGS